MAKKLNVNTATAYGLVSSVPGITDELAREIVQERQNGGPYQLVDDLIRVPGIDAALVARLRPYLTVFGEASEQEALDDASSQAQRQVKQADEFEQKKLGDQSQGPKRRPQYESGRAQASRESTGTSQQGRIAYGSSFAQVGELVYFWSDLIESEQAKTKEFRETYQKIIAGREIEGVASRIQRLSSTGVMAYTREFVFIRRGIATGAVFINGVGRDLYVSWRLFAQRQLSSLRLAIWLIACVLLGFPFGFETRCTISGCESEFVFGNFLVSIFGVVIVTGLLIVGWGFIYHGGDALSLLRENFNELQIDDIESLAHVVHKSVLATADSVGIDPELLAPRREASLGYRRRPRRL